MDTAKPLNPSSKADAADDLIEELARLMADDAQINSLPPKTAPKSARAGELAGGQGGVPSSPSPPLAVSPQAPPAKPADFAVQTPAPGNPPATPGFNLKNFNLGAPKAEVTQLAPEKTTQSASQQGASQRNIAQRDIAQRDPAQRDPAQTANQDQNNPNDDAKNTLDFDFGFGPSDADAGVKQASPPQTPAPISFAPTQEAAPIPATSDPIADLINAAVSKHTTNEPQSAQPVPEPAPQTDRFSAPPVFGLSSTTGATPAPKDTPPPQALPEAGKSLGGSMALNEIESLIGNSIKIDETSQEAAPDQEAASDNASQTAIPGDMNAQQAVEGPSLFKTSPTVNNTAPVASPPADTAPESAEAAILQAMAAAGTASRQTNFDTSHQTQSDPERATANEPTLAAGRVKHASSDAKGMKRYLVPALGLLLVGVIGVGAYTLLNSGTGEGDAPVLTADATPSRVEPASVEQPSQSVVLNEIDGATAPIQDEQLVSRDETDGATGNTVRQVITADNSEAGLANRRVRTVTVRPDGTIISGDDAVAGGEVLPVAQPNLPELPADAINTALSNTTVDALPDASALAPAALSVPVAPELFTVNGGSVPFPKARISNRAALAALALTARTQLPQTTGVTQTTNTGSSAAVDLIAQAASEVVAATTPATPTPPQPIPTTTPVATTPPATVTNPQAYVQLASQRSQDVANQTAATLQSRYSSALGGASLVVRRVDLGTRGVYFRVQLPTSTLSSANSVCSAVKNAGGDCFTRSN